MRAQAIATTKRIGASLAGLRADQDRDRARLQAGQAAPRRRRQGETETGARTATETESVTETESGARTATETESGARTATGPWLHTLFFNPPHAALAKFCVCVRRRSKRKADEKGKERADTEKKQKK